jgi:hypothetical protein
MNKLQNEDSRKEPHKKNRSQERKEENRGNIKNVKTK